MRLPLYLFPLLALVACTTTVFEPDATARALGSLGVETIQHRLGSAGPISLPASFLTAGGDLATGGVVAQAQFGAISFSSTGQVACSTGMTNCQFKQATKASDTATNAMSIQAQGAFAGATVNPNGGGVTIQSGAGATTNGSPGAIALNIPAPTGTGVEGAALFERGGTLVGAIGAYPTNPAYGALWLGGTKGATNWAQIGDGVTFTQLNSPTTSSTTYFSAGGTTEAILSASGLTLGASAALGGGVGGTIGITSGTTGVTGGVSTGSIIQSYNNNLSLWAPAATNAAGGVVLNLGATGTGTEPALEITNGGSPVMWLQRQGAGIGAIYLYGGATPTASNMSIVAGSGYTYLNAASNVGQLLGNATYLTYGGSGYYNLFSSTGSAYGGSNTLNLNAGTEITSAPAIGMASLVSDSAGLHVNTTNAASSTTLVNTVVAPVLQGAATGQQDKILKFLANVQTTSTTAVTALTIPLATSGTNGDFVVHAVGRLHSGATSFAQTYECLVENSAGTLAAATTTGISIAKSYDTAYSGAAVTCTVSGTNVLVNVAGILATTIDWTVAADVLVN